MKPDFIDSAIRKTMQHRAGGDAGPCGDENILSAYLEGSLRAEERARFEEHVSNCLQCQEVLGLAMKLSEAAEALPPQTGAAAASQKTVLFRISIPLAGVVAALFLIIAGVVVFRDAYKTNHGVPPTQTADARLARPAPEIAALPATSGSRLGKAESIGAAAKPPQAESRRTSNASAPLPAKAEPKPAGPDERKGVDALSLKQQETEALPARERQTDLGWRAPAPQPVKEPSETARPGVIGGVAGGAIGGVLPAADKDAQRLGREAAAVPATEESKEARAALGLRVAQDEKTPAAAVWSPKAVVFRFAEEGGQPKSRQSVVKLIKDRTFYDRDTYWVDGECAKAPASEIVEIKSDSQEFRDILASYPEIRQLLTPAKGVLLYWNGKICVLR